jgi:hypothetical protein
MLEDTLVIWGGEFGRTPMGQGEDGRDHHINAFSLWMAGGGVKKCHIHGQTDDFGFNVVKDPVHVHDLHATILRLMGVDHKKLTYTHKGREFRLTDVHGHIVDDIITSEKRRHQLVALVLIVSVWEIAGQLTGFLFPPLSAIIIAFFNLFISGHIWNQLIETIRET